MKVRIGLPQGLLHYQYGTVWEQFFTELGATVVLSGETTKKTIDAGSELDEICLPAKAYYGHVFSLKDKVDYLFVPRIVSVAKGQYTCPKIIAMPDMLRNSINSLPPIIDIDVDLRQKSRQLYTAIVTVGKKFGKNPVHSLYAWYQAWQRRREGQMLERVYDGRIRVALISHPYIIYDRQLSLNIIAKLENIGVQVITAEMVNRREANRAAKLLGKPIFWSNSHFIAGAAMSLMTSIAPPDGIIFMTCFSCGPDALIGELISQQAQKRNIPCMILSLDEHTAEAGFVTRLEAFTDMLVRRWDHEYHLSPYGQSSYHS